MAKKELPIVGYAVGRNGVWDITDMDIWDGSTYTHIEPIGKRGTTIERAGLAVEADVFVKSAIAWLEKHGYRVDRQEAA